MVHSDGSGSLAGVGEQTGTANQGYVVMGQISAPILQTSSSAAGGVTTQIVIPAQSMIMQMLMYVTTAWTSTTTFTITDTASNSYTSSGGGSGATIGVIGVNAPATKAVVQQWENVGNTDVQIVVTSGSTGSGAGVLFVRYMQGCNSAAVHLRSDPS